MVTGSTGGIGLETARLLVEEGAKVVVSGRDSDRVDSARSEVGAALGVVCDLAEPGAPDELIREANALGAVACLVNNAGHAYQASFEELSDTKWEEMWQLNVMSYVRAVRAALPSMRERGGGSIVNVSSTAGKRPSTGMPHYSVTKAAVLSLSRLVADIYAKEGIRCNVVNPGLIDTPMAAPLMTNPEQLDPILSHYPIRRVGKPEEVASMVLYLASDEAAWVTGGTFPIDGGMTIS